MGDETVVDTTAALLVWEPKRVVPSYAIPDADIARRDRRPGRRLGGVRVRRGRPGARRAAGPRPERPVLRPHRRRRAGDGPRGRARGRAGSAPPTRRSAGHVILDFDDFDAWYEEDERNVGHPRDPFHRIDVLHSSRHVRVERDGQVLAESSRPVLLFEPPLPVRYYLPAEDVRTDLLVPSGPAHAAAPTRARRRTGRCPASTTSPGSTRRRCARRGRSRTGSRSSTSTPTSPSTGARSSARSRPGRAAEPPQRWSSPPTIRRAPRPRVTKLKHQRMSTSSRFWKPIR